MNKYCTNCGKELKEGADVCTNCGKLIPITHKNNTNINIGETLSIAGMILGIISFLIIIILALVSSELSTELLGEDMYVKVIAGIFYTMFAFIPAIPGLILSLIGTKKKKSVIGIIGIITNILTLVFCFGVIALVAN